MSDAFDAVFAEASAPEAMSAPLADSETPQRDEQGRFAPDAPSEPVAAETPPPVTPEPPTDQHAPISALMDERDKRKAAQAERDAFAKELADLKATTSTTEPVPPEERQQAELHDLRQKTQRLSVEVDHGKKTVEDAYQWAFARCETDKAFNAEMAAKIGLIGNPYQVAVDAHKQHAELVEFTAWKATRDAPADPSQVTPTPQSPAKPIPRSLVNQPGTGGLGRDTVPMEPGSAFSAAFS